jgi:hypothetical protein
MMLEMELIEIPEKLEDNSEFTSNPLCSDSIYIIVAFLQKTSLQPALVKLLR